MPEETIQGLWAYSTLVDMKLLIISILILINLISPVLSAQQLADKISYITVASNITIDTIHSFQADNKKDALIKQSLRDGITLGVSEILKRIIHEERPDSSDNKAFPSEHSMFSCVSIGHSRSASFEIPISFATMDGRVLAKKHYWHDTLSGCGIGLLVGLIR